MTGRREIRDPGKDLSLVLFFSARPLCYCPTSSPGFTDQGPPVFVSFFSVQFSFGPREFCTFLSGRDCLVPRPYQLPAADAFQVTWSERPGRLSRIRHRNALFEKALEDAVEGQGKDRDRKNNATSNEHAKKRGKD